MWQICKDQSCFPLLRNVLIGVLQALKTMNADRPSFIWGNIHGSSKYDHLEKFLTTNILFTLRKIYKI
jgi:hypothetical protein